MDKKCIFWKKNTGFTLTELIVTLAVSAILLSLSAAGIVAWVHHADFVRNENYAETIYYAAQSELTRYRGNGQLRELEEYVRKENYNVPVGELTDDYRRELTEAELSAYNAKYAGRLYYLKKGAGEEEPNEKLNELLAPYIYDGSIMDGAICVEFDPGDGTVYSVTYSDKNATFTYDGQAAEEGEFSLADRTRGNRKENRVGYYCTDLSDAAPNAVGKTRVGEVQLVNEEQLYLKWSLPERYSGIRGFLSYTIEMYDRASGELKYTFVVKGSALKERGEGEVPEYIVTCTEGKTKEKYAFLAGMDGEGTMYLVFDSIDYGVDPDRITVRPETAGGGFNTDGFRNSASILQLFPEPTDIYVRIQAQGEPYKTSAWKQSNTTNTLFASMETKTAGGASEDTYEIKYARHLYNIRYREKENALAASTLRETCYRQTADITWPVEASRLFHSKPASQAGTSGMQLRGLEASRDTCIPLGEAGDAQAVPCFPAIPMLGDRSVLEAAAGRGYELKGFVLCQKEKGRALGLIAENRGTVRGLAVADVNVQGVRNVGAVCGINSGRGRIRNTTVSGKVNGLENVGGLVGADHGDSVRVTGASFDMALTEEELEESHYRNLVNYAEVVGESGKVGGIVGSLEKDGQAYLCENYGTAKGTETCTVYIGGIAGYNKGLVQNCISAPNDTPPVKKEADRTEQAALKGIFVGGIVGCNDGGVISGCGTEKESKDMGEAAGDAYVIGYRYVGGIIGYNNGRADGGTEGTLVADTGRTNQAKVIGHDYVGGVVGANGYLKDAAIIENMESITPEDRALFEICEIEETYSEKRVVENWVNEGIVEAIGSMDSQGAYDADSFFAGGIAGYNAGKLVSCTTKINTSSDPDALLAYAVLYGQDASCVGGIAGYNVGYIYNDRTVGAEDTVQVNSVAAGKKYVGGIVGYNGTARAVDGSDEAESGVIQNYALTGGYISGECFVGGYAGLNTTEKLLGGNNRLLSSPNRVTADYFAGGVMGALILVPENSPETEIAVNCATDNFFGTVEAKNAFAGGYVAYTQLLAKGDASVSGGDTAKERAEALYGMMPENVTDEDRHEKLQELAVRFLDEGRTLSDSAARLLFSYEGDGGENRFASVKAPIFAGGIIGGNSWDTTLLLKGINNKVQVEAVDSVSYSFISSVEGETFSFAGGMIGLVTPKATVENCKNSNGGGVAGKGSFTGGIAEVNLGLITDCVTGSVSGKNSYGGIAGLNTNEGKISNCRLNGQISGESYLGGIVVRNESILEDCRVENGNGRSESAVTGTGEYIGGIAAVSRTKKMSEGNPAFADPGKIYPNEIRNCTVGADIGAQNRGRYVGGLIGRYEGGALENNGTAGSVTVYGDEKVGGIAGTICANLSGERAGVSAIVNKAAVTAVREAGGIGGELAENVAVRYCQNTGTVRATQGNAGGVVPTVRYASNRVSNCENSGSVLAVREKAGGITAANYGTLERCGTAGDGSAVVIEGRNAVGGIAGENRNRIENCQIAGNLAVRNVSGRENGMAIGGIAGLNTGYIGNTDRDFAKKTAGESPRISSQGNEDFLGGIAGKNIKDGDGAGLVEAPENARKGVALTVSLGSGQSGTVGGAVGANGGEVRGITFSGAVNGTEGSAYGTGGIVGRNEMPGADKKGVISGCVLKGVADDKGVYVGGTVSATGAAGFSGFTERERGVYVGGICGFNPEGAAITGCSLEGNGRVSGNNGYVGGITGYNLGELKENQSGENSAATIENSGITAKGICVVGGVCGYNGETGRLENCSTGKNWTVNNRMTTGAEKTPTGGIIGCNQSVYDQKGLINRATVTGDWMSGGVIGLQQTEKRGDFTIEGCENYGAVTGRIRTAGGIISDWRYQSGRVRECINYGGIAIDGNDSRNGAGGIIGTGWWGGEVSIAIERCGNEGNITHSSAGSAGRAAGIFASYNCDSTTLNLTITDCYNAAVIQNAGEASAGIFAGKESGGTMAVTITRCVNYGKGTNTGHGFAGIAWNSGSESWTVDRCVNIGECSGQTDWNGNYIQNPIVLPADAYSTGKNYYFTNPQNGFSVTTGKTVQVAAKNKNGNSFSDVSPAVFDTVTNRLYFEGKSANARYLQFQSVSGASADIAALKYNYSAPGRIYALLLYGKDDVTKLNPPASVELTEVEGVYRVRYTADSDTEFCTKSYSLVFCGRLKGGAPGDRTEIKSETIKDTDKTVWEIDRNNLPGIDNYEAVWVEMRAMPEKGSAISPSDPKKSNELGTQPKLPMPKICFEVVKAGDAGTIQGYWVLDNAEDYAGYSGWQVDVRSAGGGNSLLATPLTENKIRSDKSSFGENDKEKRVTAYAYDLSGNYRESDTFADMFRFYTEESTPKSERVDGNTGEFSRTEVGDFAYRIRLKQAASNYDHITYRADFLLDGIEKGYGFVELPLQQGEADCTIDLSALSQEEIRQIIDRINGEAAGSVEIRYYPWEIDGIRYYETGLDKEVVRRTVLEAWRIDTGAFHSSLDTLNLNALKGMYEMHPTPVPGKDYATDTGADGTITYQFHWDTAADVGASYNAGDYRNGTYRITVTGKNTETDTQVVLFQQEIMAQEEKDRVLKLTEDNWKYDELTLTVERLGGKAGTVTYIGASAEKTYDIPIRLDSVPTPTAALPDQNELSYQVDWNTSLYTQTERAAIKGYRIVVKGTDKDKNAISETEDVTGAGTGTVKIDLSLAKYAKFAEGEEIAFSVVTLSGDTTKYLDSMPSSGVTLPVYEQLALPEGTRHLLLEGAEVGADPLPIEKFTEFVFRQEDSAASTEDATSTYEVEYFIAKNLPQDWDEITGDKPEQDEENGIYISAGPVRMEGSLRAASIPLQDIDADQAGRTLWYRIRAVSNNKVSSAWTKWETKDLPKAMFRTVEMTQDTAENNWIYTITGAAVPGASYEVKMSQPKINFTPVDFAAGYRIRLKEADRIKENDDGTTETLPGPEHVYLLVENPDEDSEMPLILNDSTALPEVRQDNDTTVYTFTPDVYQIVHSFEISRDGVAFLYEIEMTTKLSYRVKDGEVQEIWVELPEGKCLDGDGNEIVDREFMATALMDVTVVAPVAPDDDPDDPRYIVEKLMRWQRVEDPDNPEQNGTKIEEMLLTDAALAMEGIQGYYLETLEAEALGDSAREMFGLESGPVESLPGEDEKEEKPAGGTKDVSGNDAAAKEVKKAQPEKGDAPEDAAAGKNDFSEKKKAVKKEEPGDNAGE